MSEVVEDKARINLLQGYKKRIVNAYFLFSSSLVRYVSFLRIYLDPLF